MHDHTATTAGEDVAATLSELERKLVDLERELQAFAGPAGEPEAEPTRAQTGRAYAEAGRAQAQTGRAHAETGHAQAETGRTHAATGRAHASSPLVPSAAPPAPAAPRGGAGAPPQPPAARVDALRGEIAGLVAFRDRLEAAVGDLVAEYRRLLEPLERRAQPAAREPEPAAPAPGVLRIEAGGGATVEVRLADPAAFVQALRELLPPASGG